MRTRCSTAPFITPTPPTPPPPSNIQWTTGSISSFEFSEAIEINDASDFTINWGDGNEETFASGNAPSHTYAEAGIYTIKLLLSVGATLTRIIVALPYGITELSLPQALLTQAGARAFYFINQALTQATVDRLLSEFAASQTLDNSLVLALADGTTAVPSPSRISVVNTMNESGVYLYINAYGITALGVVSGGSGYNTADEYGINGGQQFGDGHTAIGNVNTSSGGVVLTAAVLSEGYYAQVPTSPASTDANTGVGTGLTVTPTAGTRLYAPND